MIETEIKIDLPEVEDNKLLELINFDYASKNQVLPLCLEQKEGEERLVLGYSDPSILRRVDEVQKIAHKKIRLVSFPANVLTGAIEKYYGRILDIAENVIEIVGREVDTGIEEAVEQPVTSATKQLVSEMIYHAVMDRASDVHIKPTRGETTVYFRIDGQLKDYSNVCKISRIEHAYVIRCIEGMCKPVMATANTFTPKDGSFQYVLKTKDLKVNETIDCRVNTIPVVHGETMTIRVFGQNKKLLNLEDLGLPDVDVKKFQELARRPSGLFVVSAPTNHGKSTTIHGFYRLIKKYRLVKTISLEDPVEEKMDDVDQVGICRVPDGDNSLTAAKVLPALMRQDPDVLGVGEIRDAETAKAAIEMSQTGHLTFTTLHAETSLKSLARIFGLGITNQDFLQEMVCLISQRLVRRTCPKCAVPAEIPAHLRHYLSPAEIQKLEEGQMMRGKGCKNCNDGYRGLLATAEYIVFNNEVRDWFTENHKINDTIAFLREKTGFVPLWEKGLDLAAAGQTSLEEIIDRIWPDR